MCHDRKRRRSVVPLGSASRGAGDIIPSDRRTFIVIPQTQGLAAYTVHPHVWVARAEFRVTACEGLASRGLSFLVRAPLVPSYC